MSYKDIWYPITKVWTIAGEEEGDGCALGGLVGFIAIILRFALFIMESTTSYKVDFDSYWIIVSVIAGAAVLYPITVSVIYTPIAIILSLLKAIYDVLYYRVFKLGEVNGEN